MTDFTTQTLVNPQNGHLAFKIFAFDDNGHFDHIQRHNYYSLVWVTEGKGSVKADFSEFEFDSNSLFSFAPYQPFMLNISGKIKGVAINFHPDFFCILKHQKEVSCNGVLFNNIYDPPFVKLDESSQRTLETIVEQIKAEMKNPALAQYELLNSYLKIILITASRLKTTQQTVVETSSSSTKEPFILQTLKDAIDQHYTTKHSVGDYADMLNITPKALAKITKEHFNKTISDLITERIIIEAKRELYLTNKTVKEIAYVLGYEDEHYFSRFFKNNADVSLQTYRETVGVGRGMG